MDKPFETYELFRTVDPNIPDRESKVVRLEDRVHLEGTHFFLLADAATLSVDDLRRLRRAIDRALRAVAPKKAPPKKPKAKRKAARRG